MSKKYYLFISLAALIALSSCSSLRIEKRHYNKGWYVDFSTEKKHEAAPEQNVAEEDVPEAATPAEAINESPDVAAPAEVQPVKDQSAVAVADASPEQPAVDPASTDAQKTVDQKPSKQVVKETGEPISASDAEVMLILLVILAILLPPLAVYLKEGVTAMFWITLICWLFGGFFFFGPWGFAYLGGLGLVAIILALLVVFDIL